MAARYLKLARSVSVSAEVIVGYREASAKRWRSSLESGVIEGPRGGVFCIFVATEYSFTAKEKPPGDASRRREKIEKRQRPASRSRSGPLALKELTRILRLFGGELRSKNLEHVLFVLEYSVKVTRFFSA